MSLNEFKQIVFGKSILDFPLLPSVGDEIAFTCPSGLVIEGAIVEKVEFFCGQHHVFVSYTHIGWTGREVYMTGWVCMSEVI